MNSLRLRLSLGFALVAVVPLAVAMALLSERIQTTVRAEAGARLAAALGILQVELRGDGERLTQKLDLLARDPELKRLYLVESANAPGLREYLANQQFLLGLDYLTLADTSGRVLADGASWPAERVRAAREPIPASALGAGGAAGLRVAAVPSLHALALDASAPVLYRDAPVGLVRGGEVLDAMLLARLRQTSGVELVLFDSAGAVVASTLAGGPAVEPAAGDTAGRRVLGGRTYLARGAPLEPGRGPHARILALYSTAAADRTVEAIRWTTVLLGLAGLALAIVLGLVGSHLVSRPVERLADFSQRISRGDWDEPLALESVRELQTLVEALERMRGDLGEYRERLRAGERQAAYGRMARKVAHEIKNPLTPIAVSVADLKRSYELQRPDFPQILDQCVRTIGDEVETLKRLLQEFSDFGRFPSPRLAACDLAELTSDLSTLYGRELAEGRLTIEREAGATTMTADRGQLRQALVNLIQNGLEAAGERGRVALRMRPRGDALEIVVSDDGPGLTAEQRAQLFVPGFTTKTHGSGLGLTIVERIVSDHHGTIAVESPQDGGATFVIRMPLTPEVA